MALSGLWEIPREAVYLDHEAQPSGLNKQPRVGFPINHERAGHYKTWTLDSGLDHGLDYGLDWIDH